MQSWKELIEAYFPILAIAVICNLVIFQWWIITKVLFTLFKRPMRPLWTFLLKSGFVLIIILLCYLIF